MKDTEEEKIKEMGKVFEENGVIVAKGRYCFKNEGVHKKILYHLNSPQEKVALTNICQSFFHWEQ